MGINSFWLFYVEADSILVALINWGNGRYYVASIGPRVTYNFNDQDSILQAADKSLSSAASSADLPPEQEPLFVGLVIPSSWVGEDGKILKGKSEIILPVLKSLDLKATGFMSSDEAIIEESRKPDDFPASFISIYLESSSFDLSLVYLGKIKNRIKKYFDGDFTAQIVEEALLEINSESTLPPQIYIYGNADENTIEELKNFPWVGKKNVETFLHLPDIKLYSDSDLINIFFKAITSQMLGGGNPSQATVPPSIVGEQLAEKVEDQTEVSAASPSVEDGDFYQEIETISAGEDENEQINLSEDENVFPDTLIDTQQPVEKLDEVPGDEFGFSSDFTSTSNQDTNNVSEATLFTPDSPLIIEKKSFKFSLPKIKTPKFKSNWLLVLLPSVFFLFLSFLYLSKVKVVLHLAPYEFKKTINVTLDANSDSISSSTIPVKKKETTVQASISIPTTGKMVVGEKATGEVTIYNKLEKIQNIPKGSIIIDSKGQKFETITSVQVAASVTDYNTGTMNFGQLKTSLSAFDIGPEYNISKDATLTLKDVPESSIVIKSNTTFTGGSKQEVLAVSKQDKLEAERLLDQELSIVANKKMSEEISLSGDILKETIQSKKGKLDFNREVGEQTDQLTANGESTISVFMIDSAIKKEIINYYLSSEADYSDSDIDINSFALTYDASTLSLDQSSGLLSITGSALPKIDTNSLRASIAGKSENSAKKIIRKAESRAYDINFTFIFDFFKILSFNKNNISIEAQR